MSVAFFLFFSFLTLGLLHILCSSLKSTDARHQSMACLASKRISRGVGRYHAAYRLFGSTRCLLLGLCGEAARPVPFCGRSQETRTGPCGPVTPSLNHWTSRADLRNKRDVAHPRLPTPHAPPLLPRARGAATTIPKKPRGRGLSWATRLLCKGGVGGVALGCGLQASGSGPGCAGCAGGGEACNLVPRYPRTPVSPPRSSTPFWGPMSGSVDFSQMARSWALVPRPGAVCCSTSSPCHLPAAAANP